MKDMHCKKSCIISVVALFVFFFVYEFAVNMFVLKDMYTESASLWRPMDEIHSLLWLSFVRI